MKFTFFCWRLLSKIFILQNFYELCAFIEYVGRLPTKDSSRTRGHYIAYRYINFTWIRNDDERCHTTHVDGQYKVNMAFYKSLSSNVVSEFMLDVEGILHWKKAVMIRGVFKPQGRGWGHRGRRGANKSAASASTTEDSALLDAKNLYIFSDTTSSEDEDEKTSKRICPISLTKYWHF